MIEILINDRAIACEEGQPVLEIARKNGIPIPHLCFHPALKPSGACRLCGVEVTTASGRQAVQLACILKARPGMAITTDSPQVLALRQKAFDRLFHLAPDAARIRELAKSFGITAPERPDGCIRCRLCVRVCSEIVKARALKMEKTVTGSRVGPGEGQCIGCGTCANLCPTNVIRVEDLDGVRTVSVQDRIVGQLPLEHCEACGRMYATCDFLDRVEHLAPDHPHAKETHHLCPSCAKLMSSRAIVEKEQIKK